MKNISLITTKVEINVTEGKESARKRFAHEIHSNIALTNLVYNMCRLVQIKKYQPTLMTAQ